MPGTEVDVFGSILHRMILWELTKVFVMSLVGITGILLMAGIIAEASQQGLGPTQILAAIPLLVPSTLPYTIPATTLFATCVVYGRLSADNEILAIKSAGINAMKVVRPGIILGLVMSSATMGLYYRIIPYTHYLLRAMVYDDAEELLYSLLKKHNAISFAQFPYSMYVQGVRGKKLLSPVFKRKDANGQIDYVAHAREAELQVLRSKGQVLIRMKKGVVSGEDDSHAYFENKDFIVDLPKDFGKQSQRRPRDLTWQEILQERVELQDKVNRFEAEISASTSRLLLADAPDRSAASSRSRTTIRPKRCASRSSPSMSNCRCAPPSVSVACSSSWSAVRSASGSAAAITSARSSPASCRSSSCIIRCCCAVPAWPRKADSTWSRSSGAPMLSSE